MTPIPQSVHKSMARPHQAKPSSSNDKTELLRKFHTITSMIHTFQTSRLERGVEHILERRKLETREISEHRQVLDALAMLLVREHEEIAVVSNEHFITALELRVLAAYHTETKPDNTTDKSTTATSKHEFNAIPNVPLPRNQFDRDKTDGLLYRHHGSGSDGLEMVTVKDEILVLEDPISYAFKHWRMQTFQEHAGAVIGILNKVLKAESLVESDTRLAQCLLPYVIIKSSPKIFRRLTSKYSKRFWVPLTRITPQDIKALPLSNPLQLSQSRIRCDRAFLTVFGGDTQRYLKWIGVETPCLLEASIKAKNGEFSESTFYSATTSSEIHTLLCALLQDLRDYTCVITQLTSLPKERFCELDVFKGAKKLDDAVIETTFKNCVNRLCICLHLLWLLVHSSAMEAHINRIQSFLPKYTTEQVSHKAGNVGDDVDEVDEVDGEDAGNEAQDLIDADSETEGRRNVASCVRWLRLQVSHYQAIDTLGQTCRKLSKARGQHGFPTLSIKIVASRHPGNEMQPWRELVKELAASDSPDGFTADAAISAIDRWMDVNRMWPLDAAGSKKAGAQTLLSAPGKRKKFMPTWYTRNHFGGTNHCEAILASLIGNKEVNADVVDAFRCVNKILVGISKRCCPVCTLLLELLFLNNSLPMHTCGSHHTIYPCSLPSWLPKEVIEKMIATFEDILRRMLCKLVVPEGDQRRSGDFETASIHSVDSHLEDGTNNITRAIWANAEAVEWTNKTVTTIIDPHSEIAPEQSSTPHSCVDLRQPSEHTQDGTVFLDWAMTILAARKWFKTGRRPGPS